MNILRSMRLRKKRPLPPVLMSGSIPSPFLRQNADTAEENLRYISETVAAAMRARCEAIGKGRFTALIESLSSEGIVNTPLGTDHPLVRLLREPNPISDLGELLELVSQWLDATGNALLLKVRGDDGLPKELWVLPSVGFRITMGDDHLPAEYLFYPNETRIPASDIIHIKRSDIRSAPYYGHSLIGDIIDTARTDAALRYYQQKYLENDAVPKAVLTFPEGTSLGADQLRELQQAWEEKFRGIGNASRLAILPDGGEISMLTSGAKEMDFGKSRSAIRDAIREAFRVPKIVLGDTDDVNLSNAETSYAVFLRDVVDYALEKISRALTRQLASEFAPNIVIRHENVIPESEERRMRIYELFGDALSVDEKRTLLGAAS
jgi:HK97 family phage portal protein